MKKEQGAKWEKKTQRKRRAGTTFVSCLRWSWENFQKENIQQEIDK